MALKNKELTKKRIVDAFENILVNEGFHQLKIRYIASCANVDKVLIYRYFGGLEGLATAYAEGGEFWPDLQESLGTLTLDNFRDNPDESIAMLIRQHIRAIKKRKAVAAILVWELVESSPVCKILAEAREQHAISLYQFLMQTDTFNITSLTAFGAIFGASLNYLIIRSQNESVFSGIPIQSEEGWNELENMFVQMAISNIKK
ncbi:TetR/AcrR family transcriptional regulator [Vibrio salinus]|uniref:TetR/AcrR family transcriptional regulator n=1 Tax=Vibrio salinus TaxID=2899784 RepID=UPI001E451784|nr:TetR/AcrR family transcriptional regulator [Vibrio salinus]MCE0495841.1 TetR/AcrR family transcriptional regulator [Vibrio salinus]